METPRRWGNPDGTPMICGDDGCDRVVEVAGLCARHYQASRAPKPKGFRVTKWVNPDGSRKTCTLEGCEAPIKVSGLCSPHYHAKLKVGTDREKKPPKYCPVPGCGRQMANRKTSCAKCNQTMWRYGLSSETWIQMNEARECSIVACKSVDNLHIDHDHSCPCQGTFKARDRVSCGECVRGWLCRSCNLGLGYFRDSPELLAGISQYLRDWKTPS